MDGGRREALAPPVDSLVSLAARKALPAHQYMDAPTVAWIASHRDQFHAPTPVGPLRPGPRARRLLAAAPIPPGWHVEPRTIASIHGTRHLMRTAALAAVLADLYGLVERDTATLIIAALMHDCRRVHDKDDDGHGERGAAWLGAHAAEVFAFFDVPCTEDRLRKAMAAIRLHEIPYAAFSDRDREDHAHTAQVTDLLKTADALDRYRLPKIKWWPNDDLLRAVPPPWLRRVAFELVVETEEACLHGVEPWTAVESALLRKGLL
jgi:hypothetical protein